MSDSNKIEKQSAEFDAVSNLSKAWKNLALTAVVDDDYPEVRHRYESALSSLITALKENNRIT